MAKKDGITAKIRKEAPALGVFSVRTLALHLNLDRAKISSTVSDMTKCGELIRLGVGQYRYSHDPRWHSGQVREKVLRAIHVRGIFSVADIRRLSDAHENFAREIVRDLVRDGHLEQTGRKKNARGCWERSYRVRHRDRFFLEFVKGCVK